MLKRLRKWWYCRRYGICPIHGTLRPHGGYNEGKWAACAKCLEENRGKSIHRDLIYESNRHDALERLNSDWQV
jgi:hypothetical protein